MATNIFIQLVPTRPPTPWGGRHPNLGVSKLRREDSLSMNRLF
jgi:hypothetical protein